MPAKKMNGLERFDRSIIINGPPESPIFYILTVQVRINSHYNLESSEKPLHNLMRYNEPRHESLFSLPPAHNCFPVKRARAKRY